MAQTGGELSSMERDFFDCLDSGEKIYSRADLQRMGFAFQGNHAGISEVMIDVAGKPSRVIEVTAIVDNPSGNPEDAVTYLYPANKIYRELMTTAEKAWEKHQARAVNDMNA